MRYDKTNYNRLYAGELEDWSMLEEWNLNEVVEE
jgi:hypothetical protein